MSQDCSGSERDNVLVVKVSHPWIPPGGRSLDSLVDGGFSLSAPWVNLPLKEAPYFTEMHWDTLPSGGSRRCPSLTFQMVRKRLVKCMGNRSVNAIFCGLYSRVQKPNTRRIPFIFSIT